MSANWGILGHLPPPPFWVNVICKIPNSTVVKEIKGREGSYKTAAVTQYGEFAYVQFSNTGIISLIQKIARWWLANLSWWLKHIHTMASNLQRSHKWFVRGCEKFVPVLAYLFCLALPGSCLARFTDHFWELCNWFRAESFFVVVKCYILISAMNSSIDW